ncbi:extensin family protein [Oceaniglobus indicus]|uniref:extensin-like domain-containing protein n=1 Tax=Oceaniglobus indicus TaxID=2047749 RepID=UPI000C1951BA|nr:extensin family protein [Oceaniglobus indicus]
MKHVYALALVCAALVAETGRADAPTSSPRPQHRDGDVVSRAAPLGVGGQVGEGMAPVVLAAVAGVVPRSPRPQVRPENLKRRSIVAAAGFRRMPPATGSRGALCGDPDIQGVRMSRIAGRIRGCGVEAPVQVTAIAGVALSTGATMDCTTAKALKTWVERGVKPVIGRLGGGVASLKVAAHYSCRARNNKRGARISEHGKGRAVDISSIVLKNGASLSVLKGWRDPAQAGMMKTMHRAACGPFGTVLGPNADRYHQDHFHFDTARYRSGSYCK